MRVLACVRELQLREVYRDGDMAVASEFFPLAPAPRVSFTVYKSGCLNRAFTKHRRLLVSERRIANLIVKAEKYTELHRLRNTNLFWVF